MRKIVHLQSVLVDQEFHDIDIVRVQHFLDQIIDLHFGVQKCPFQIDPDSFLVLKAFDDNIIREMVVRLEKTFMLKFIKNSRMYYLVDLFLMHVDDHKPTNNVQNYIENHATAFENVQEL